jgi:hypothetical protein
MMDQSGKVEQIRSFVRETLSTLGAEDAERMRESMLIRDGYFCGWRFDAGGLEAIWFVEEAEIKFIDCQGAVIQVTDLSQGHLLPGTQRAA